MSLGEDVTAALPGLRYHAESMMVSTCEIAAEVLDDETGEYEFQEDDLSYTGPCKIRFNSGVTSDVDAQQQLLVVQAAILSLPVAGSESVAVQQVCRITANPFDPGMVGKKFRITGDHTQTLSTARRFPVELISGG